MFSGHTTPKEFFSTQQSPIILNLCLKKLEHYREVIVFCTRANENAAFLNSSGLKSFSEKLRFLDVLKWTVGSFFNRTKAAFSSSSSVVQTGPWVCFYCFFFRASPFQILNQTALIHRKISSYNMTFWGC